MVPFGDGFMAYMVDLPNAVKVFTGFHDVYFFVTKAWYSSWWIGTAVRSGCWNSIYAVFAVVITDC